jgi:hypothetical protein
VTDANGCTQSTSINIPFGLTIAVTGGIANIGCEAGNIGSIDVTPGGGSTPFSFIWSNGSTTEDLNNIGAGTYTVTISDANGCSASTSTTIQGSSPLSIQPTVSGVTCFGDANGDISIVTVGGTLPLSYLWNNGSTTQNLSGLSGGSYNLTVTDANGCTATTNTTLIEPAVLAPYVANAANITCAGDINGFIDVEVNGGVTPFSYLWITGATTQDLSNLPAGDYKVLVTDANGCTAITGAIIKDVDPLTITVDSLQQVGCTGANDGAIYITADGGSEGINYAYLWSNGSTNEDITGLGLGTYTLTVTDGNGCTVTSSTNIGNSNPPDIQSVTSGCGAGGSGVITILADGSPSGSALLYSINGTTFQSSNIFTNVASGTYTVTVKGAISGCASTANVVVTGPATITNVTASCNGGVGTGSISITATAPAGNTISYSINGADYQNFNVFTALANGTYTVYVKNNNNNCVTTQTVNVNCLNCSEVATANNNGPVCAGGNVGLTANSGGIAYAWSGAAGNYTQQNPFIIGITSTQGGVYTVTVTYASGCTATATTNVVLNAAPFITAAVGSCNGLSGVITITATGSNLQYSLNGFNYQTSNVFTNQANGTYTVYVRNTATGCIVSQTGVVVNCNACAGTVVASSNSPVCTGSAILLTSTIGGGTATSYAWSGPAGVSTFPNPTIANATPAKAGVYTVTVTFAGGCTATASTTIVVRPKPTIQSAIKTCLADGGRITVTAISNPVSNGVQYSLGGVNYQTSNVFSGLPNGSYTVYVRDNVTGCVAILSTPVVISCGTTCTATASNNGPVCPGSSIQLNSTAGGVSYVWSGPSGVSSVQNPIIPNMTPIKTGVYTVTITYASGCTATATTTLSLKTAPVAAINASGPTTFCSGGSVDVAASASGAGPMTYIWNNGTSGSIATITTGGTYTVTVTNSVGCTTTSTINITVTECCQANAGIVTVAAPPCPNEPLIATISGYNSSASYAQYFLLVNASNTIIAVNTTGIFATTGLAAGNYSVFGYNVQISPTAGGANPPAVGSLISALTGNCYALSNAPVSININALPVGPLAIANVEEGISGVGPFTYNTTTLDIVGGTLPYQFDWEINGYVRYDIVTNAAGDGVTVTIYYSDDADFTVTISDSNGCTNENLQYDNSPGGTNEIIDIDSYEVLATAEGEANGTITLQVSGGDFTCGQYTYEWFGPDNWVPNYPTTGGGTYVLEGAVSGWYQVIVTDCNGQMTEGWYWVPEGTRGRSKLDLDALMRAYPNPFDQVTTISFMMNADTDAKVLLYGTDGRIVSQLFNGRVEKDVVYDVQLDGSNLPVGVYYVRLLTGTGTVRVEKLVVSR